MTDTNTTVPATEAAPKSRLRKSVAKAKGAKAKRTAARKGKADAPNPMPLVPAHVAARTAYATAATKTQGVARTYLAFLNRKFGLGWYKVAMAGPASDNEIALRESIKGEKEALYALLKDRKHSNPSKVWADLKALAKADAEGGKRGKRDARSYKARFESGPLALWKSGFSNWATLTEAERDANALLEKAIARLFGTNRVETEKAKLSEKG